jgi:hypothetical protein
MVLKDKPVERQLSILLAQHGQLVLGCDKAVSSLRLVLREIQQMGALSDA